MFFNTVALPDVSGDGLAATVALLIKHRAGDYYAYEHHDTWHLGLGSQASLCVSPNGKTAMESNPEGKEESIAVGGSVNDVARVFVAKYSSLGKVFGQVGFNYSAIHSGQAYNPGKWPVLTLMVPRVQVSISKDNVTVSSDFQNEAEAVVDFIKSNIVSGKAPQVSDAFIKPDVKLDQDSYTNRVAKAISNINEGKYVKTIPSRMVQLPSRVDMLATLHHGRRANTPARSFSLSHAGIQATGFSPEVLLSIDDQIVFTEALAGTQLAKGADVTPAHNALLNDPKEVMEHCMAVKGSTRRLSHICAPESISVKNFMSIVPRGNVNHLFSHVEGRIVPSKDGWDALPGLIANITVPGVPGQANMDAINDFESYPRDMYCGAALMLDPVVNFFEATLVLRTVFQDDERQWLQAGAGVTALSKPEREFNETCEKLESIAPWVVAESKA